VLVDWTALAHGCALDLGSRVPSGLSPRLLHLHAGVGGRAVVTQAVHQAFSEMSLAHSLAIDSGCTCRSCCLWHCCQAEQQTMHSAGAATGLV